MIEGIARDAVTPRTRLDDASPTLDATGKVVVVTGGSKGLGRAMALGFAEAGADVVVASRKLEPCEAVADEVRAMGRRALAVSCHVGDWDQCAALVDATVAEFGRIDVLVNNAGHRAGPAVAPIDVTEDLFDKTIAVNLKGPLRLTALAAEHMSPGGSIINISSKASLHPTPFTVVYAAAKAGLNALTKAAADELGPPGHPGERDRLRHVPHRQPARVDADPRRCRRRWRRTSASAGSRPPTRSSAPRCTSRATRRRTSPASSSCSTAAERAETSGDTMQRPTSTMHRTT